MLNKIHLGDSRELLKKLEDNSIDMVLTSPPYDNLRSYQNGEWSFSIFKEIASELVRVLKDGGVIVWVVSDATIKGSETGTSFKHALWFKKLGLCLYDTMIWRKPNPSVPTESRYYNCFEYMFILSKGKPHALNLICDRPNKNAGSTYKYDTRMNPEERKQNGRIKVIKEFSRRHNVWDIPIGTNKTKHPAVFPELLAHDHIITWSNEGDTVLDPFVGSGTTCKVAKELNRNWIGIEKVEEYYKISCDRVGQEY